MSPGGFAFPDTCVTFAAGQQRSRRMTTRVIISIPHVATGKAAVIRSIDRTADGEAKATEIHRTSAPAVFETTIWDGRSFDVYEEDVQAEEEAEPVAEGDAAD
jgi:hypothetical protein